MSNPSRFGVGQALVVVAATLSLYSSVAGAADLDTGRKKLLRGDYKNARGELSSVTGKDRESARLLLVEVLARVGEYAAAEKEARGLLTSSTAEVARAAAVALSDLLLQLGRYDEARRLLEPMVTKAAGDTDLRHALARVYRVLGRDADADRLFQLTIDAYDAGQLDLDQPEDLYRLASAARQLSHFQLASQAYEEAVTIDRLFHRANIEWGSLALSKYNPAMASQSFDDVLRSDGYHPDAHNGMALAKLEASYDVAAALHHLDEALAVNPKHVPSLLTRASLQIDQNKWDSANETLEKVLAINPQHLEALSLIATIHWLRDDRTGYEAAKKRVFAINPHYAALYHLVARSAVREHRYEEAIALEEQAVQLDPDYFEAMEAMGTGYLRLGREKEGLSWLEKSWAGDQYNMRTFNVLNLFDDTIPKNYGFVEGKKFRFRYPNDEQEILHRYIAPLVEDAFAQMVARYGFEPKTPVVLELFADPEHYSVRTVGLPNLGALGVCFGQVVTAMSPSNGNINWGMVLWHELSHVFALQLSNSRVPRWFTEGLSEYETLIARPEWRRENDADLYAALADGSLPSVADINEFFVKPNMQQVMVAYYLSAVTIEYIADHFGFDQIIAGLRLYGQGKDTAAVLTAMTGMTVKEFDQAFQAYLTQRLAPYRGTFHVPSEGYDDIAKLEVEVASRPKDAGAHAALALGHFFNGDAMPAQAAADKALKLDSTQPLALYISGELAFRQRDAAGARRHYQRMIELGADSFDVRARLATIARAEGKFDEAIRQLCAAKALDPERSYPYMELFQLYKKRGQLAEALVELETYVMLEQMQVEPLNILVAAYAKQNNWRKVRTYGEMSVLINPSDSDLLMNLGRAYLETGVADKALFSFESALMVRPPLRRPALAHVGRAKALSAKGDRKAAKLALEKALAAEPTNAEALALQAQLR